MPKAIVIPSHTVELALRDLGQALRRARIVRGDTQAAAAERIGVHVQTLRRIEAGSPEVAVGHLFTLMEFYNRGPQLFDLGKDDEQTLLLQRQRTPKKAATGRT